jgi:CsoR family transcriptional regulator, copper-sensing transcriptional repressor
MDQTSSVPDFIAAFEALQHSPPCGCGVSATTALAVDPSVRYRNVTRLRRIEGQVRGLQKMIQEDRYCADIMTQVSSVHEALRAVGRELMRNHLRHCATVALRSGEREQISDEIIEMIYRAR